MSAAMLPEVNSLVRIRFDGNEYASRVEDGTDGTLVLAAPSGGGVETPRESDTVALVWGAGERGRYTATIRLVTAERGHLPLWTVELVDAPRIEQRRQFVRAGGGEPIQLRPAKSGGGRSERRETIAGPLAGRVVDISEGGVRVSVVGRELAPGQLVTLAIELGPKQIGLDATVRETLESDDKTTVAVLTFEGPTEKDAQLIRRYVMHRQLAARNGRG